MSIYFNNAKSFFTWGNGLETLEDLDDVLNEPPPAPGAPLGNFYPEITSEFIHQPQSERYRRVPLSGGAATGSQGEGHRSPCESRTVTQAWQVIGAQSTVQSRSLDSVDKNYKPYQPASPYANIFKDWTQHFPVAALFSSHQHTAQLGDNAEAAGSIVLAHHGESQAGSSSSTAAAPSHSNGWGSYFPPLPLSRIQYMQGAAVDTANAAHFEKRRTVQTAANAAVPSDVKETCQAAGLQALDAENHMTSQLASAIQWRLHQAGSLVASPMAVSVLGATVGGIVAGPFGVAVGAKSGVAMVAMGALGGAACHYATHINVSSAPRIVCTSSAEAAQDAQGKIEKDCAMSQLHVQTKESDEQVGCDIVGHQQGTSQAADSVRHAGYEAPEGACGNS